jgi:hypothetical protein
MESCRRSHRRRLSAQFCSSTERPFAVPTAGEEKESGKSALAELVAASYLDEARMPPLQLGRIQESRIAIVRRRARHIRTPARALHVLMTPVFWFEFRTTNPA